MHAEQAYLFRHVLLKDAAYQLQLPFARAALHQLAIEVIELVLSEAQRGVGPWAAELAEHAAAALRDLPEGDAMIAQRLQAKEFGYLKQAAEHCVACYETGAALGYFARLAEHDLADGAYRCEALGKAAASCRHLGRAAEGIRWVERGLKLAREQALIEREAELLGEYSTLHWWQGRKSEAAALSRQSLQLLRGTKNTSALALGLARAGSLMVMTGQIEAGLEVCAEALALFTALKDQRNAGKILGNLGYTRREMKQYALAESLLQQAIASHRVTGDMYALGNDMGNLASLMRVTGRLDQAEGLYLQAIELLATRGIRREESVYRFNLGRLYLLQKRPPNAESCYSAAAASFEEIGDLDFAGQAVCEQSFAAESAAAPARAEELRRRAAEILRAHGHTDVEAQLASIRQEWNEGFVR